ncbi:serine protease inhibitor dipetalogastin-like [Anoplophora glabripennis]|uniref:serine protease inhibitor dipetalogastin-like n=1 Tax=Anoplophora glabripennis TaxID=217634 RepID=UPI000C76C922|nr:serine protease inhibitor dipetalogastin-like [Anoplophora glabripennis]
MSLKLSLLLFVTLILGISCSPSRVVRQATTTVSATTAGTTTTTASPAYNRCIRNCLSTSQYNPVCGTDGVTYFNMGKLNCAIRCGGINMNIKMILLLFVTLIVRISCNPTRVIRQATQTTTHSPAFTKCLNNCVWTSQFDPVCGTDGVTYSNIGQLYCATSCDRNVQLNFRGPC